MQESFEKFIDLNAPGVAKQVARRTLEAIDNYCQTAYDDGHRNHLGASLIGHPCRRYLWYVFRWVHHHKFDGRMQRLFNRGHREEDRFIEWLQGAGFEVWTHDESQPKKPDGTYPQFRVSYCGGHFGGSLDGIAEFPKSWGISEPVLLEFKTNGTGPKFDKLVKNGMILEKPRHFAQTCTYGSNKNYRFKWLLYLNIDKNTDKIHCEIVKLDWNTGDQMVAKASSIVSSQVAPPRLSENPTYQECKYCDMLQVCHYKQVAEVNCRSCKFAVPADNAKWECTLPAHINLGPIPAEILKVGCEHHSSIIAEQD